ncbi:MAG: ribosome silencing factor [Candidatus Aminicenantia bacterium]
MKLRKALKSALSAAIDKKAENIVVLEVKKLIDYTDYFVMMSGNSTKQNQAIHDSIIEALKKLKKSPLHVEGVERSEWILLDYGSFIIHIFSPRAREYYDLESLWGDAKRVQFEIQ